MRIKFTKPRFHVTRTYAAGEEVTAAQWSDIDERAAKRFVEDGYAVRIAEAPEHPEPAKRTADAPPAGETADADPVRHKPKPPAK